MSVFVCGGFALIGGARGDVAPRALGTAFVLLGSTFADPLLTHVAPRFPDHISIRLLRAMEPAALNPAFFWQFAWAFPRTQPGLLAPSAARAVREVTYYTGVVLFVALAASGAVTTTSMPYGWSHSALRNVTWTILVILSMPTVVLLLAKLQTSLPDERRRLRLFIGGIVLGNAPLFLEVLADSFVPAFHAYTIDPAHQLLMAQITAGAILLVPATTAYAVVVDRVLETRFIVRMAIQYALARFTVFGLMTIPVLVLISYLYRQRHLPLAEIIWSVSPVGWVTMLAGLALIAWLRAPILHAIDRRFFREHHDAREILVSLTDSTRRATSLEQMVGLVRSEIDRAFHVENVTMLVRRHAALVDPTNAVAPLGVSTALATLAAGSESPFDVEISGPDSALARLPGPEREWLASVRARLIVPLLAGDGAPIGLLALGEKRSEAPYSPEDRALLKIVAAAAATAVTERLRRSSSASDSAAQVIESVRGSTDDPARECLRCELVLKSSAETCEVCGSRLFTAAIPKTLCGKFAVERRIGSGGMGVVYLALDISLRRLVALKTLHRLSPAEFRRLRREARALATLQHEHLEVIYGVESWRGSPMLVLEYLAGGTLASRVRRGRLDAREVAKLGISMAEALHSLHRAGVLHCDIKPSNVGFTTVGIPKLLDFGLAASVPARYEIFSAPRPSWPSDATTDTEPEAARMSFGTDAAGPAGTLMYMSPEAVAGAAPEVSFDLWSLAVTLYEALSGFNPFAARDRADIVRRILAGDVPDLSRQLPDCPRQVSAFISDALNIDSRHRPSSAREFAALLRRALNESGVPVSSGKPEGHL
jgi:hypothetical protein